MKQGNEKQPFNAVWDSGANRLRFHRYFGGLLNPGYSHIAQPVSDLIAAGAPNKPILDLLFALYNLLVIAFSIGLVQYVRSDQQNRRKVVGTVGAFFLLAQGIFGLLTLFFPEDLGGMSAGISRTGMMHIVFAGLSSITTMLTILLMGFWFKTSVHWQKYGRYSFISVRVVLVSGGYGCGQHRHRWFFRRAC